jgi:hypothetical protein
MVPTKINNLKHLVSNLVGKKWRIPLDLLQLQCRWITDLVTYNYGNDSHCFKEISTKEKQIPLLLL